MKNLCRRAVAFVVVSVLACGWSLHAADQADDARVKQLGATLLKLSGNDVLAKEDKPREMLPRDISRRLDEANQKSSAEWRKIKSREDWENFRDAKIALLRASLHLPTDFPNPPKLETVAEIKQDSYVIRKIIYETRPNWQVTANLYLPAKLPEKMPGILLSHSHHSPKTQGELRDMGAIWAMSGCAVLVPDHLGHGERRQHPFISAESYPDEYQVSRQDYFFRFNTAMQLYACGESLMGWMVWDLMRGLDVLESMPNIDQERIGLFGGVAGGGDPAAVTAALDKRVTLLVPFNFGGPQPETKYPLPDDAEQTFDYAGGGSWESTRNLHLSARDGFLPWVIVGSVAPRGLIHSHEFSWDKMRDPVWKRYDQIFRWYDAHEALDVAKGFGNVKLSESEASHCGNIGKHHRAFIHVYLAKQWNLANDWTKFEQSLERVESEQLTCLVDGRKLTPLREVLPGKMLEKTWLEILGNVEPTAVHAEVKGREELSGIVVERFVLSGERDLRIPGLLFLPAKPPKDLKVTLVVAQAGKADYVRDHSDQLGRKFMDSALCIVDVRGTGETCPDHERGRKSYATSLAASELMLGEPLIAGQLRDLRSTIAWLRTRKEFSSIELVGDAAEINAADEDVEKPLELDQPELAETLGPTLVLLACYLEDKPLKAHVRGGLANYRSLLESPFVHVPFDAIIPGAIAAGDLDEVLRVGRKKHDITVAERVNARSQREE